MTYDGSSFALLILIHVTHLYIKYNIEPDIGTADIVQYNILFLFV